MKIIIVGAGIIGANLAQELSKENHEVYLVEQNEDIARAADEKLDAKVIVGEGADPNALIAAGIDKADLVIAVTASDETNLVVCSLAAAYGAKKRIARVRNVSLNRVLKGFGHARFYIDEVINPEQVAAEAIVKVMQAPGASEVADFAGGKILLRSFNIPDDSPIRGIRIEDLHDEDFPWPFLIVAINRKRSVIIPKGDAIIKPADCIYALLPSQSLGEFLTFINPHIRPTNKVVIYGATNTGETVAVQLTEHMRDIVLLEEDTGKAEEVAGRLTSANIRVIKGFPSDADILNECGIEAADAYVAASNNDHSNLVSAVLAKKMGAKTTVITTHHPDYLSIVEALGIDVVINPRLLAAAQILRVVRGESVSAVTKLVGCDAEALELIPEVDSPVTKAPIKDITFPKNSIAGAVFRGSEALLVDGNTHINAGEHVIVFCQDDCVPKIQKLFTRKKS